MKNKQLKPLRIDTELYDLMNKAISILNKNNSGLTITQMQFRRWAYKYFSDRILAEGLSLEFKPKSIQ